MTLQWKWLQVKESIDHTPNTFKAHSNSDPYLHRLAHSRRQPSTEEPASSFNSYTFYPYQMWWPQCSRCPEEPLLSHIYNKCPLYQLAETMISRTRSHHHVHLHENLILCTHPQIYSENQMILQTPVSAFPRSHITISQPHPPNVSPLANRCCPQMASNANLAGPVPSLVNLHLWENPMGEW